jgi:hypothetical protein
MGCSVGYFVSALLHKSFILSLEDTVDIVNHLIQNKIVIRFQLFRQILYPILTHEIDKDNIEAIKSLIKLLEYYGNYQNLIDDNKYSVWKILDKGLQLSPNDTELLKVYQYKQKDYFEYTLHELPAGVLFGADGATIEQCEELLNDLTRYEEVCSKLSIDPIVLVDECRFYYLHYKNYLTIYKDYIGFADYLDKHQNEE